MKDSIPTSENIFIPNEEVQTLEVDQQGKNAKGKSADLHEAKPLPVLTTPPFKTVVP